MKKKPIAKARIVTAELTKLGITGDYVLYLAFSSTAWVAISVTEEQAAKISTTFRLEIEIKTGL